MIAIVDYGVGNLFSLSSSLKFLGVDTVVSSDSNVLEKADKLILPGVGAFGDAYKKLENTELIPCIKNECRKGKPLLGICLGMQMLFEKSFEYGEHKGLGLIGGEIAPFKLPVDMKVPHMGWNSLELQTHSEITKYIKNGDYVYFVHSYHAQNCEKNTIAVSEYGVRVPSIVQKDNIFGTQFHPEKSGEVGLSILRAFCEMQ